MVSQRLGPYRMGPPPPSEVTFVEGVTMMPTPEDEAEAAEVFARLRAEWMTQNGRLEP